MPLINHQGWCSAIPALCCCFLSSLYPSPSPSRKTSSNCCLETSCIYESLRFWLVLDFALYDSVILNPKDSFSLLKSELVTLWQHDLDSIQEKRARKLHVHESSCHRGWRQSFSPYPTARTLSKGQITLWIHTHQAAHHFQQSCFWGPGRKAWMRESRQFDP